MISSAWVWSRGLGELASSSAMSEGLSVGSVLGIEVERELVMLILLKLQPIATAPQTSINQS